MKTVEISASVRRLVKKQKALLDDATYRINVSRISKFDRMQFRRALDKSPEKQLEVAKEISQKILGPDFQAKAIKVNFGMLRQLAEIGLTNYAMYHQLIQPDLERMIIALNQKGVELMKAIMLDEDLGL